MKCRKCGAETGPAFGMCSACIKLEDSRRLTMNGMDWAYATLVGIALAHSKEHVRERAMQFKNEVLDECVGMACADIDWPSKQSTRYAYEIVRDVCVELTKG